MDASLPEKAVHVLLVPGFADWEPAHALAELRRSGRYRVETVGFSTDTVESMGGLRVQPTRDLADVDPKKVAIFILPGGEYWEEQPLKADFEVLLHELDRMGVPIAAICAATTAVARAGLLRGRRHTSNGLSYLQQHAPQYTGQEAYVDALAVRDRGLITASGVGDIEFAAEILAELAVLSATERTQWTHMFRSGQIPEGAVQQAPAADAD